MKRTLNKDQKDFVRRELKEYKATIGIMTEDEKKELHGWVAAGNSVHENPWYLYEESGHHMDYINALRCTKDLCEEMGNLTPEQLAEFEKERDANDLTDTLTDLAF